MQLHIATDLWGRKENVRLVFDHHPTLAEVFLRAEAVYGTEAVARRPVNIDPRDVPIFRVTDATILVDDAESKWVNLVSDRQLYDRAQLFVFQPPHPLHSEARDLIPFPREPLPPMPSLDAQSHRPVSPPRSPSAQRHASPQRSSPQRASPRRAGSPGRSSRAPAPNTPPPRPVAGTQDSGSLSTTELDVVTRTFQHLDRGSTGSVHVAEVKALLVTMGFDTAAWPEARLLTSGRNRVTFPDWMEFCAKCPNIVVLLAQRLGLQAPVPGAPPPQVMGTYGDAAVSPRRVSASPRRLIDPSRDKELSPCRAPTTPGERQRKVSERLYSGKASIVTSKDRREGDYSHAVNLLPSVPAPTSARRTPTRTRSPASVRR